MWLGVKDDVRDSIWMGRPVYDKFGHRNHQRYVGGFRRSTQFNYRVWVIR